MAVLNGMSPLNVIMYIFLSLCNFFLTVTAGRGLHVRSPVFGVLPF